VREAGVVRQPDGLPEGIEAVGENREKTAKPRGSAAQTRLVKQALDNLPLSVAVIDRSLRLQYWNLHAAGLFGIAPTMVRDPTMLADMLESSGRVTPRQSERIVEFCSGIISEADRPQPATWLRLSLGRQQRVAFKLQPLGGDLWLLVVEHLHPVAEGSLAARDAMVDALTGLSNRRHFNDVLREVVEQAGPYTQHAVLVVDLDHFKSINDALGHPIGDALLCLVAQRLHRQTREEDVVARLGGDEFAILLPDGQTAEGLASRLVDVLSRPFLVEGHIANIGASIGIARYGDQGSSAEDLLHQADLALRDAKSSGRRTWRIFDPATAGPVQARWDLETDLRKALTLGELSLAYQPQLNLRSNRLTGFEALLRWNHPTRGEVLPVVFIPVAEDIGCIQGLGEWVIKTACQQAARWPDSLSVAVNVSPVQLADCEQLFKIIESALQTSGLAAPRLEIEITVGALLAQEGPVLDLLHRLHALGVHLVIEDFGTEYWTLSQLPPTPVPFDKIKIDQSIIAGLGHDGEASMVVRAITSLGSDLGKPTTAEGVETAEQARLAETDGCTHIQGFLISRPIPAAEIDGLLRRFAAGRTTS
jgi:diguanylate cyclase (GGDEF)-like protein